jgi:hypothetical protein
MQSGNKNKSSGLCANKVCSNPDIAMKACSLNDSCLLTGSIFKYIEDICYCYFDLFSLHLCVEFGSAVGGVDIDAHECGEAFLV